MDNQTSSQHTSIYGLASGLAFFCGALLALSFGLRIFSDFALSPLVNESLNWLQGFSNADNGLALLRRYGGYALGNIELITFSFLLISPLRMLGAKIGMLLAGITLLMCLLVSIESTSWFSAQPLYASTNLILTCLFGLACVLLLRLGSAGESVESEAPTWKQALEEELADEAMQTTAIDDYTELSGQIPFHTPITDEVEEAFSQLLLDTKRELRDVIEGQHRSAFTQALNLLDSLPEQKKYFPRQPMIIPKLIRAVNSDESSKKQLVDVISQDPVIAGELLRVANSPYYRLYEGNVDSIGRAILVLGVDGLRFLTSTLVLQPVAQAGKTYFPGFTKRIWLQSVLAANAAQAYARKTRSCDSFTAHLLGLLSSIGHIVIFQMLLDVYKNFSGLHPKIEVLNKLQRNHADDISAAVIASWNLSDDFISTLKAYQLQGDINALNPLGRALYYGRLCASLHMLCEAGSCDEEQVRTVVLAQGLHSEVFEAMWEVLNKGEASLSDVWG